MTVSSDNGAADLGRRHPEWLPWLTVIEQVLREATDTKWEGVGSRAPKAQESKVPLLAGATLDLDPAVVAWRGRTAIARRLSERRAKDVRPRWQQTGAFEYHGSIQILALPELAASA